MALKGEIKPLPPVQHQNWEKVCVLRGPGQIFFFHVFTWDAPRRSKHEDTTLRHSLTNLGMQMWEGALSLHICQPSSTCLRLLLFKLHVPLPALIPSGVVWDSAAQQMERQQAGRGREGTTPRTPPEATLSPGGSTGENQAAFGKAVYTQLLYSHKCSGLCEPTHPKEGTAQSHRHVDFQMLIFYSSRALHQPAAFMCCLI